MIRRCRQPAGAWNSASGCQVAPPRQPRAIPDLIPDFRPFLMSVREKDPVVVVGAGIVGVCCALYLLRDGRRVILIDRGEPGEGTSFGNGSIITEEAVVPVQSPGIARQVPAMLTDPLGPPAIRRSEERRGGTEGGRTCRPRW